MRETVKFGYYTQGGIKAKKDKKSLEVVENLGSLSAKKGRKISAATASQDVSYQNQKKQYKRVENSVMSLDTSTSVDFHPKPS